MSRYELEVKLSSAKNLKNVNWRYGPNKPYAVVWVDPSKKSSTNVDEFGDTEANWDQTLVIPLPLGPLQDFTLYVDVVHAGSEADTKPLIGSAKLKLHEVLEDVGIGERTSRTLKLKRPSGRPQGKVDVRVAIREPSYRARGAYDAPPYGVPPPHAPRDYPPAPPAYGYQYGAPPPTQDYYSAAPTSGYPYSAPPPPEPYRQPSYGYEAAAPVEKKKSKFGGMGTGLAVGAVAGVLGGLAIAEGIDYVEDKIADDAAEKVEDDLYYDDE